MILTQPRMNPAGAVSCDHTVHTNEDVVGVKRTVEKYKNFSQSHYKRMINCTTVSFCFLQTSSLHAAEFVIIPPKSHIIIRYDDSHPQSPCSTSYRKHA
jgi:hypothetical protein